MSDSVHVALAMHILFNHSEALFSLPAASREEEVDEREHGVLSCQSAPTEICSVATYR